MSFTGNLRSDSPYKLDRVTFYIVGLKLILTSFFSSDYQDKLFIPFVEHFLSNLDNPWQYYYQNPVGVEFPYHPLMLYILTICYAPLYFLMEDPGFIANIFFKLPVLLADLLIFKLLQKTFPGKIREIVIFYFASPIIIYASYIHSQLDLIPTAVLFLSIYLLTKNQFLKAALFFGLALSIKLHVLAAVPLLMIYMLRKDKYVEMIYFFFLSTAIYLFFIIPFMGSEGFEQLVWNNPKQKSVFEATFTLSNIKILLPLLAAMIVYTRFLLYKKINNDLMYTFLALLFSLFVILIPPSPAWYVWLFPFLSIFFIRNYSINTKIIYIYGLLNLFYLIFFVVFYIPEYSDLNFLGNAVDLKILKPELNSISFTLLVAVLLACVYAFYNFGIKSNAIYKKENSLIIGVGGDSGSGKSSLLKDLKLILGNKLADIEGDGDHKWERNDENWNAFTHLDPKANFLHKQSEDLLALKQGSEIYRADYDHATGSFTKQRLVKPKEYISISGLHPFYLPIMRKIIDLKIFMNTDERLRLHWKILRDVQERGYPKEKILQQIEKRSDDSMKYISPQKNFADLVINYFTEDTFELGSEKATPSIKLKIILNADMHLEPLLQRLFHNRIDVKWDYSEDLNTQFVILHKPLEAGQIKDIAKEAIMNVEELISQDVEWLDGYRGFTQLVILFALSEQLKGTSIGRA